MDKVTKVVLFIMTMITVLVWSIVGLIFWFPILFRTTAVFCSMIVYSTITNDKPETLGTYLESAAAFYVSGFRTTLSIMNDPSTPAIRDERSLNLKRVVFDTMWTIIFWVLFLTVVGINIPSRVLSFLASLEIVKIARFESMSQNAINIIIIPIVITLLAVGFIIGIYVERRKHKSPVLEVRKNDSTSDS